LTTTKGREGNYPVKEPLATNKEGEEVKIVQFKEGKGFGWKNTLGENEIHICHPKVRKLMASRALGEFTNTTWLQKEFVARRVR